ncbi:MAG: DUF1838 domain-containing protein [Steroidobacteraceae bacterium]|nr:DUF1838 domain-containing protein [Steroidobacteraceae bacterium]
MTERSMTRRDAMEAALAIGGGLGLAATTGLGSPAAAAAGKAGIESLGLDDPKARARLQAKVKGSIAEETVYTFCRLHLYLYMNDGNLVPAVSMQNLNVAQWRPLPNGNYAGAVREVGVYTRFDTDEVIDWWENPVTGERREVWQFVGGPLAVEIGPDGVVTGPEATLKPKSMRPDVIGDMVIVPNGSAFSFPTPFKPDQWPKEAGAATYFWDSHYYFAARLADVLDPKQTSVPAAVQFQNLVSFHPWFGMGQRPGRTYGKGLGAKLKSLDGVPAAAMRAIEKKTPEILDVKSWTKPRNDFAEYMQQRKPT